MKSGEIMTILSGKGDSGFLRWKLDGHIYQGIARAVPAHEGVGPLGAREKSQHPLAGGLNGT